MGRSASKVKTNMIRLEKVVNAPLDEVWKAWTTTDGLKSFHRPGADIDLRIGGNYDIAFGRPADRGKIVGFLPLEMLSVEWTAAHTERHRVRESRLVILFERRRDKTVRVKVAHIRLDDDETELRRLQAAWTRILDRFDRRFSRAGEREKRDYVAPLVV